MPIRETHPNEAPLRKFLARVVPKKTTTTVAAPVAAAAAPTQAEFNALVAVVASLRTAVRDSGVAK
jgi:hypothetical protein